MTVNYKIVDGLWGSIPHLIAIKTNMKKRKYYRLAEKLFPEEKDRKLLAILAEGLRKNNGKEPSKEEMGF